METAIYGWKARLGYAGPSPLATTPHEFWKMAPDGVALVSTGLHVSRQYDGDMEQIKQEIADAVRALEPFGLDCISIATAPLVYLRGRDSISALRAEAGTLTTAPTFYDHEAVIEAARHLGARRIVVLSPFGPATNQGIATCFQQEGLNVVQVIAHSAEDTPIEGGRLIASIADQLTKANADLLYIAGDAWPVADDIAAIERTHKVSVVTEAQALLWLLFQRLHIRAPIANFGRLLTS